MAANTAIVTAMNARSDRTAEDNTSMGEEAKLALQQRDTAQYVADMILEMRNMAKAAKLYTITVPLEYAYYEAFSVANRVVVPAGELERLKQLSKAAEASDGPASA